MSSLAILLATDKERLREGWAGEQADQMERKKGCIRGTGTLELQKKYAHVI